MHVFFRHLSLVLSDTKMRSGPPCRARVLVGDEVLVACGQHWDRALGMRKLEWRRGREGERKRERERERERIPSRLCTISAEPDACLEL